VSKEHLRTVLRAIGFSLHHSDEKTDWFTPGNLDRFYDVRWTLPYQTLLCGEREGGLVVYYDRPHAVDGGLEVHVLALAAGRARELLAELWEPIESDVPPKDVCYLVNAVLRNDFVPPLVLERATRELLSQLFDAQHWIWDYLKPRKKPT